MRATDDEMIDGLQKQLTAAQQRIAQLEQELAQSESDKQHNAEVADRVIDQLEARDDAFTVGVVSKMAEDAGTKALLERITQLEQRERGLMAGLESIIATQPCQEGGSLFRPHFDGEGNEVGVENIDPLSLLQCIYGLAQDALTPPSDFNSTGIGQVVLPSQPVEGLPTTPAQKEGES